MSEPRRIAVIDFGKTNAKLVVFDLQTQQEIEHVSTSNTVLNSGPYPHYNIEALWDFIMHSLHIFSGKHKIDAVSITTHGASAALLDANGNLALPVLDYEHDGPQSTAAGYDAVRPSFAETGSPRLPNGLNLGAQIFWQQNTSPKTFAKVRWIVTYPQYWAHKLCGMLANEVTSLGCHTDLWAFAKADYSTLVDTMGWRSLMPSLRGANERLGTLHLELAKQTGLQPQTPIYCGIHDSNASLFPHLLGQQAPFSVVSSGTWVICMAIGGKPALLDAARDTLMNVNAFGQPVPSSRFMGGREFQLLASQFGKAPTAADAEVVLSRATMLLPSVVKGCGPFPDHSMRWVYAAAFTPEQKQVCASYYLAMMTATCMNLIGAQGDIIVEGPLAENNFYLQMLSIATSRAIKLSRSGGTGTTLGAAFLASSRPPVGVYRNVTSVADGKAAIYAATWFKKVDSELRTFGVRSFP